MSLRLNGPIFFPQELPVEDLPAVELGVDVKLDIIGAIFGVSNNLGTKF